MSTSSSSSISAPVTAAPLTFTGVSKFASSLQQVLSREVSIASLPLDTLNATLTTEQNQQSALQSLEETFLNLQQSISGLQSAVSSNTLSATTSNSGIVNVTVGAKATAGTYSIEVATLGSASTALSTAGSSPVTDPSSQGISSDTSYNLNVGGTPIAITANSDSLDDLVGAINTQAAGQVQATIVNVGSTSSPDYRLSLQSATLSDQAIALTDSSANNLIASSATGSPAGYYVDGQLNEINSDSDTITLSPGLTVNLVGQSQSGQATTITVSNDPTEIASAFSSFASAYNAAVDAVATQHGQNGGALEGNSLLGTLSTVLSQLGTYSNGSAQNSLASFGITVDDTGQLSIDTSTFGQAAQSNFSSLLTTLGSSTSGGFLQTATNLLSELEDPTTGLFTTEASSLESEVTAQQTKISDEQTTVNNLQTSLTQEISSADATIASLESQVTYVSGLFAQYTGYNSNNSNNGLPPLSEPLDSARATPDDSATDILALLSALEQSTRQGNWRKAAEMAAQLDRLRVPTDPEELGRYLAQLRRTLVTAKSSRAHAIAFLRRVNAAAGFCRVQRAGADSADGQNFVDSAEI